MKDRFWDIFRQTGEPMCFLLSKAEKGLYDMPGEGRFANDAAATIETMKATDRHIPAPEAED